MPHRSFCAVQNIEGSPGACRRQGPRRKPEDRSNRCSGGQNEKKVLDSERRLTITTISEEIGLSFGTVHTIVTEDLTMRKVCAKLVPKVLSEDQKTVAGGNFARNFGLRAGR